MRFALLVLLFAAVIPAAPASACLLRGQGICLGETVRVGDWACQDDTVDVSVLRQEADGCDTVDVDASNTDARDGGDFVDVSANSKDWDDNGDFLDVSVLSYEESDRDDVIDLQLSGAEKFDSGDDFDVTIFGNEMGDTGDGVNVEVLTSQDGGPADPFGVSAAGIPAILKLARGCHMLE